MGGETYVAQCSTVPTITGSEMRFSVKSSEVKQIRHWPLRYVQCEEITPPQHRLQWGVNTFGARLDSYKGLRLGSKSNNLELGFRSTNVDGRSWIAPVERQRVGVATLTLGGAFKLSYWNDHAFWWWPMGDGGDQGDTAGLTTSYNLGNQGFYLFDGWTFQTMSLTLRLATGIPQRSSAVTQGGTTFYSHVAFDGIDRGDIDVNTSLFNRDQQRLDIGLWVDSGKLRHAIQSDLVHRSLGIPEFPETSKLEVFIYIKLEHF